MTDISGISYQRAVYTYVGLMQTSKFVFMLFLDTKRCSAIFLNLIP